MINTLDPYQQTYIYDTGGNLTRLSHQAKSSAWQQNISIHSDSNQGTETKSSATDFDANGNLLTLNNIGTLDWHYNNTLNKLTKDDKNTVEYYIYDHQGNRVRTVFESNQQIQNQRDYLPSLDISTSKEKQQTNTLHIGTRILSEITKNTPQTRYQLSGHLHSNTLELNDKAQTISYEHFYPYGSTNLIAGTDKTQVRQKRYRYTGKERDDNSGLSYYGARYFAPWLARWISPDSSGTVNGLNLYVYVGNNPLKYTDPTGHNEIGSISWNDLTTQVNSSLKEGRQLNLWVGEDHEETSGMKLVLDLIAETNIQNVISENATAKPGEVPRKDMDYINLAVAFNGNLETAHLYKEMLKLSISHNTSFVGTNKWINPHQDIHRYGARGNFIALVGSHHIMYDKDERFPEYHASAYPVHRRVLEATSIALLPLDLVDYYQTTKRKTGFKEYGVWVEAREGEEDTAFLILGAKSIMKREFGKAAQVLPKEFCDLQNYHSKPKGRTLTQRFRSIFHRR